MPIFRSDFPQNARAGFGTGTLIVRYGIAGAQAALPPGVILVGGCLILPLPHSSALHRFRRNSIVPRATGRQNFPARRLHGNIPPLFYSPAPQRIRCRVDQHRNRITVVIIHILGKAPQCRPSFSNGTYHCPISFRYRLRASCQVGRGVKPFSTSLDLSRRLLKGRTALERPYSAVVTGRTVVVSPA